jgi:3-oxoacyl-[acyl-carrier protein] reductase
MNLSLEGKRAMVCGSTQGIGKATAIELAELGASITLVARNEEKLKAVLAELDASKGQNHTYIAADFTQPEDLRVKLQAFAKDYNVNILVNNTGGPAGGPANAAHTDEYIQAFTNHLICNQILVQNLMEGMKTEGYGRIINIISTSVKQPLNGLGVSNTIRGAVANWSKTLANELGAFNITVNNVLPGATNTVRLKSIIENKAKKTGQTEDAVLEAMKNQVPMKRIAEAQEVANAIAFLASPAASYINGINVPVDGGRTACL